MSAKKKFLITLAVLVVAAGFVAASALLNAGRAGAEQAPPDAVNVQSEAAHTEEIVTKVTSRGKVELVEKTAVYPVTAAKIKTVHVKVGDPVAPGQLLIDYDDDALKTNRNQLEDAHLALTNAEVARDNARLALDTAQISRDNTQLSRDNAQLALETAQLALDAANLPPTQAEINQAEAQIAQGEKTVKDVQAQIEQQEITLAQYRDAVATAEKKAGDAQVLYDNGVVPKSELDAAQDAAKAQRSQLDAAQLQRSALETGLAAAQKSLQTAQDQYTLLLNKQAEPSAQNLASQRKVQAEQARVQAEQAQLSAEQSEVSVRQAENQVRQAEIQVEQATLRIQQITKQIEDFKHQQFAEATGTVLSLAVQGGDVASVGRVLMEIGETSNRNLKITANIPEYDIAAVELDQAVEITGNALGKSVCRGVVSKLAPVAEQRQVGNSMETVVVVEIAPNPEDPVALRPGYSVETTIVTDIAPNTVVVPIMAVVSEPNGDNYVYVIRDKYNLEKRPILTGRYSNIYVEAIGVAEGERVVVSPPEGLTEDSHVRTNLEA